MTDPPHPDTHDPGAVPPPTLVFLHLPKTAGTSLQSALDRCYPAEAVYRLEPDARAAAQSFVALPEDKRHAYRLVSGHQVFGLHRYAAPGARYLAMLRDPLQRAVSDLRHRRRAAGEELSPEALRQALLGEGDRALATRDNLYTRWLSATPGMAERYADEVEPDAEAYDRACSHLDQHFAWLGVTERFYASAALLAGLIGRGLGPMPKLNAAPGPSSLVWDDPAWDAACSAFRERNRWDQLLYARALAGVEAATTADVARRAAAMERAGGKVPLGRALGYLRRHGPGPAARRALSVLRGRG